MRINKVGPGDGINNIDNDNVNNDDNNSDDNNDSSSNNDSKSNSNDNDTNKEITITIIIIIAAIKPSKVKLGGMATKRRVRPVHLLRVFLLRVLE